MENLNLVKMNYKDIKGLSLVKNGDLGLTSKVYRLDEDNCIKIFNKSKDDFEFYRYNKFTNLTFDDVILPKKLVLIRNKFKAYVMDFVNGDILYDIDPNVDYSKILNLANNLFISIESLNDEGIIIFDAHSKNIMYDQDNDKLVLTDPDEWSFSSVERARNLNFRILNWSICEYLFGVKDLISANLFMDISPIDKEDDFIDYYESLREYIEKEKKIKIKTVGDSRNFILGE